MFHYISTRGKSTPVTSAQAILNGIAPDGGLYVPEEIPVLSYKSMKDMDFCAIAKTICGTMLPDFTAEEISACVDNGYAGKFDGDMNAPVVKVGDRYVTELFHGPTRAFKDIALSLLPRFMTTAAAKLGISDEIVILAATSGDTGSAAIEGFKNVPGTRIITFYPEKGISDVQRAQMVTVDAANVKVCAVNGNFDDAQAGVKRIFTSVTPAMLSTENHAARLSSANSINIGRLLPQIAYYFSTYITLLNEGEIAEDEKLDFCVPTGNFGDILAGWFAKQMGLPVGRLLCASNKNDVLTEFFRTGVYNKKRPFHVTNSPSMDILVSSNLERLLYFSSDADTVASMMSALNAEGTYALTPEMHAAISGTFDAACCGEDDTLKAIGHVFSTYGYLMDTHTAVAWDAADHLQGENKMVILSTASPYKFSASVLNALGEKAEGTGFDCIRALQTVSGVQVSDRLAGLEGKAVMHTDVRDPMDLDAYVIERVRETVW